MIKLFRFYIAAHVKVKKTYSSLSIAVAYLIFMGEMRILLWEERKREIFLKQKKNVLKCICHFSIEIIITIFFVPVTLKNRYVGNMCKCMAEFIDLFHKLYYL